MKGNRRERTTKNKSQLILHIQNIFLKYSEIFTGQPEHFTI